MKHARFLAALFALALLVGLGPACSEEKAQAIDGYVALVPAALGTGERAAVSLSLFSDNRLASGEATVALVKDGQTLLETSARVPGKGTVEFEVPQLPEGEYELVVSGAGFQDKASVRVEDNQLIFLETDKPIYKPGQTIHVRAITLDRELKPVQSAVTIEVVDAKGIKVFKKELDTDDYGTGTLEIPVSQEPNLGVWKVAAGVGDRSTEVDVRIEEYVLPKYEVQMELPKEWFLVDEPITGKVTAEYSYGKPVKGELEVKASRYVGEWEEFASFSKQIDGEGDFELPAAGYVAGVPEARGMGNVTLEVTVREQATSYEQKTTRLLTVSASPVSIQIIPESSVFRPTLPFGLLFVTETPDNQPVDAKVYASISYMDKDFDWLGEEDKEIQTENGLALVTITPPADAISMMVNADADEAYAWIGLGAAYSPSGNFIHVEQVSSGPLQVGDDIEFRVHSTQEAANFYYEVVSRGKVVFTSFTDSTHISFQTTPLMAPSSKLLVYQILANSEVAADYIPFDVEGDYPHAVQAAFSEEEVEPGAGLQVQVQTEGQAKVGLVAVDRSVFILAENRLNLQQVFDELERLYMEPQAELHSVEPYGKVATWGAEETFENAGVVVLTNKTVPQGEEYGAQFERGEFFGAGIAEEGARPLAAAPMPDADRAAVSADLTEVQRIRQYFPETWLWTDLITGSDGTGALDVQAPDSITTWVLRAVGLSKDKGLGVDEAELVVLQPFFIQVDLPYSAIRGEEFPVSVALYNYEDQPQEFFVELEEADWFEALGETTTSVTVQVNEVGGAQFMIRPTELGIQDVKVTARSRDTADAVIKNLSIVPEGVEREVVENFVLSGGGSKTADTSVPPDIIEGSGRAYVALTSSYLTQTIEGLDGLLQMPFGCGEQNMILFAPDVFIARYLKETGQLRAEIMAKAEKLMITGYQREMTYRRSDGSFSAFGESDDEGSLWLTAFVLRSFAQATDLMYIDQAVLDEAGQWIASHQQPDGSFESVGFVHHQDMMGGLQGKTALTAYAATALMEAGDETSSAKAVEYLEGELDDIEDAYTMAIVTYALAMADSQNAAQAYDELMGMAEEDEDGLHWGSTVVPLQEVPPFVPGLLPEPGYGSTAIEATGYATLALIHHGDRANASRAAKWLVGQRNAYGGFGSTQDTVVALHALTEYAVGAGSDVDLDVTVQAGGEAHELHIDEENFDVLQVLEVPIDSRVEVDAQGRGQLVVQVVTRFNLPEPEAGEGIFDITVDYGTEQVEVNDLITVAVDIEFDPPIPLEAGMVVLDVSVPTGFAPVRESIDAVVEEQAKIKRYEVAGRKVIFYIENMLPGDSVSFDFQAQALYPVKAKGVASQAYSYYKPEWKGETLGQDISVSGS